MFVRYALIFENISGSIFVIVVALPVEFLDFRLTAATTIVMARPSSAIIPLLGSFRDNLFEDIF